MRLLKKTMPNQRVQFGGPTVFEGIFLGNDTGFSTPEHHEAHAPAEAGGHDVQIDASDIHGPIGVTHNNAENIIRSVAEATGQVDFIVDAAALLTKRGAH